MRKKDVQTHTIKSMKKILFVFIFFLTYTAYSQDTLFINNSKWIGYLNNGLRQGLWREYLFYSDFNNYQLASEGYFVNNKKNGAWKFYGVNRWGSFELTSHGNFVNDIKERKWVYEGEYGYHTGNYKNGVKHGVWLSYDLEVSDSIVYQINNYVNGIPSGIWELFNPENGKLVTKGRISKGQMVGFWKTPGCSGRLKINPDTVIYNVCLANLVYHIEQDCEDLYETNNKIGKWKYFYYDGALSSTGSYINGKKEGVWKRYFPTGIVEYEGKYTNGEKIGIWKEYYNNGKLKCLEMYVNGKLNGDCSFYTHEGHLIYTGQFANGYRSGEWKSYTKDSIVMAQGNYNGLPDNPLPESPSNGYRCGLEPSKYEIEKYLNSNTYYLPNSNKQGFWIEYNCNGGFVDKGIYDNGKKTGKWETYSNNDLRAIYTYKDGILHGDFVEFNWAYLYVWRQGAYKNGNILSQQEFKKAEGLSKEDYLKKMDIK